MSVPKHHIAKQTYYVAFYSSRTDTTPKVREISWAELKDCLRHPAVRKSKDGRLFSPARLNGTRKNKNVQDISMLVVEYDHDETFENAVKGWKQLGVEFVAYTTHSHLRKTENNPNAEPRFRVVIPLREPISARTPSTI